MSTEQRFLRSVKDETKAKFDALLRTALTKSTRNKSKSSQHLIQNTNKKVNESSDDEFTSAETTESESAYKKNILTKPKISQTQKDVSQFPSEHFTVNESCSEISNATFTKHKGEGDILSDKTDSKSFLLNRFLNANVGRDYEANSSKNELFSKKEPPIPKPRQSKIISNSVSSNNTTTRISKPAKLIRDDSSNSNSTTRTYDVTKSKLIGDIQIHKSPEGNIPSNLSVIETSKTFKKDRNEDIKTFEDSIALQPIGKQTKDKISYDKIDVESTSSKSVNKNELIEIFQNNDDSLKSLSTSKQEAIELQSTSSQIKYENEIKPKPRKRTKIKKKEESSFVENEYKYEKIISITVHKTGKLKLDSFVIHPVVKVHVVNAENGEYLKKTDKNRAVVFYLENSDVSYLLPVITRNFNLQEHRCLHAEWEETIIINEDFEYLIDPKSNVIIFFEILDFVTFSAASSQSSDMLQGWHKIAWAFLKIVGKNNSLNINKKLQLQLYQPGKPVKEVASKSEIFHWWKEKKLVSYPSTLYVTVNGVVSPEVVVEAFRSKTPLENEKGSILLQENLDSGESSAQADYTSAVAEMKNSDDDLPRFKFDYEVFKLPNKLLTQLDSEEEGCFALKFSHSGLYLACSVLVKNMYTILVYSVSDFDDFYRLPSHRELIYNITWSMDDSLLLSSSADGTVSIWDLKKITFLQMLPHPSFVYWCEISNDFNTIATCCYDQILRVWTANADNKKLEYILHDELVGHKGYVTCVCFGHQSNIMFSSDSAGGIMEWKIDNSGNWNLAREIQVPELKGVVINQIILHKRGKRLIVHTRDDIIRIIDVKVECTVHWLEGACNNRVRTFCCVTPCFSYVLAGSETGILYVWNLNRGQVTATYHPYEKFSRKDLPIHCVDYNPKQNMLAFSHYEHDIPIQVYVNDENVKSDVDLRIVTDLNTSTTVLTQSENVSKQKRTKGISVKSTNKINLQNILEKIDKIIG